MSSCRKWIVSFYLWFNRPRSLNPGGRAGVWVIPCAFSTHRSRPSLGSLLRRASCDGSGLGLHPECESHSPVGTAEHRLAPSELSHCLRKLWQLFCWSLEIPHPLLPTNTGKHHQLIASGCELLLVLAMLHFQMAEKPLFTSVLLNPLMANQLHCARKFYACKKSVILAHGLSVAGEPIVKGTKRGRKGRKRGRTGGEREREGK